MDIIKEGDSLKGIEWIYDDKTLDLIKRIEIEIGNMISFGLNLQSKEVLALNSLMVKVYATATPKGILIINENSERKWEFG